MPDVSMDDLLEHELQQDSPRHVIVLTPPGKITRELLDRFWGALYHGCLQDFHKTHQRDLGDLRDSAFLLDRDSLARGLCGDGRCGVTHGSCDTCQKYKAHMKHADELRRGS